MKRFIFLLVIILSIRLLLFYLHPVAPKAATIPQSTIFTQIKGHIKSIYDHNLNPEQAGLLMGIVFGEKDLDRASMKNFQKTGVLHIIAASGMNVSMLTSFLLAFLLVFMKRQYALILTFATILFYTAMADFQASIVRAAIMAGFALGAGVIGRQNTSILALFLTAFAMIFWDPTVAVSVSFILSFSATLGIILLDPIFKKWFKQEFLEDFRTTLAAQIATTPIILFFFGTYSPISILTNLLVLWTVPPLMIFGGLAAITSVIPLLSVPFVLFCTPLLAYFLVIINFFTQYAVQIQLKNIPWVLIVGYYLVLGAIILQLKKNKS